MSFLRIIRPINLFIIVLVQLVLKLGFLEPLGVQVSLGIVPFLILTFATVCIAAAGNVINDIFDVTVDLVNKPEKVLVGQKITEKAAYNYYLVLNVLGVGAGFYVANHLGKPGMAAVFIFISALLYVYAYQLKSVLIAGNLLISILVAMSLWIVILFDIFPAINTDQMDTQVETATVIFYYGLAALFINLLREIVKDLQDVNGDRKGGRKTLPIAIGRQRAVNITFTLGVILLVTLLIFTYQTLYRYERVAFYFVFLIGGPLLFFCIKAWSAETVKDFKLLSVTLKIIMVLGICSIILYRSTLLPTL